MQFSKIFLKIIIHNQKSIVKDIRLIPFKKPSFPNQVIKKGFAHTENLYNIFEVKHCPIERSFKMLIPKLFIQMKKQ